MEKTKSSIIGILLIIIPFLMYYGCVNSNQLKNYSLGDWERRHEQFEFTIWDQVKSGFSKEVSVPLNTTLCRGGCFNRGSDRYDVILQRGSIGISIHYEEYEQNGGLFYYPFSSKKDRSWGFTFFSF